MAAAKIVLRSLSPDRTGSQAKKASGSLRGYGLQARFDYEAVWTDVGVWDAGAMYGSLEMCQCKCAGRRARRAPCVDWFDDTFETQCS